MVNIAFNIPSSLELDDGRKSEVMVNHKKEPEELLGVMTKLTLGIVQKGYCLGIFTETGITQSKTVSILEGIKSLVALRRMSNFHTWAGFIQTALSLGFSFLTAMPIKTCCSGNCYYSTTSIYSLLKNESR